MAANAARPSGAVRMSRTSSSFRSWAITWSQACVVVD